MKISQNMKQVISFILAFTFIVDTPLANAATAISPTQRPVDFHSDIINSSKPSDLPVAGYSEYFDKENINIIKNIDLSNYKGMKAFVGYGIYDVGNDNCHFVNVPGKTTIDYTQNFKDFHTYNKHTYGISRNNMNYNQCLQLTKDLGGYPVSIDSSAENNFVDGYYANLSDNPEIWIGATINSCSEAYYTNSINRTQFFLNFKNQEEKNTCSSLKKNVYMNDQGQWIKANNGTLKKCLVEFESEDYMKPIKVCAPWWKIFRDYKNNNSGLYDSKALKRINQADLPTTISICTKYDSDQLNNYANRPRRDVTCTSYYSRTVAPECNRDMKQDQCKVNECQGYIKNTCRLKSQDTVGKGYIKGQIIQDDHKISVKVKDDIVTYLYSCPPSPPSNKACLEKSKAIVWSKECPGSQCQQLKECLLGAKDSTSEDACENKYTCEKIYPSRDIPPLLDNSGNVVNVYGLCEDGTQLAFKPNILNKDKKVCEKYEEYNVTKEVTQKCLLDRTFSDHTVNVAFTDTDDYQNNPNCLRTDKVEDSQRNTSVTIDMKLKNYFKHRITKLYLDGSSDFVYDGGSDSFMLGLLVADLKNTSSENVDTSDNNSTCNVNLTCTGFEKSDQDFFTRNQKVLLNGTSKDTNIDSINLTGTDPKVVIYGLTNSECKDYGKNNEFGSYVTSANNVTNAADGSTICTIKLSKYPNSDNQLSQLRTLDGSQLIYKFSNISMTKEDCLKKAVCIGGTYNEQNYGSDYSSTGICSVQTGETPDSYTDYLEKKASCQKSTPYKADTSSCDPGAYSDSAFTELNGFESILVFEDYIGGPWGYYSNFNTFLPLSNFDKITTPSITANDTFPLTDLSSIVDYQWYVGHIDHIAYKSKKPDLITTSAAGGVAASAAYYGAAIIGLGPAAVAAVVVVAVVLILTAKSKSMDSQKLHWAVYKNVTTQYFSRYEKRTEVDKNIGAYHVFNRLYLEGGYKIPKEKGGAYRKLLTNYLELKKQMFLCNGWNEANFNSTVHPAEKSIINGHPGCKWYNPWCEKSDSYVWNLKTEINKKVNTIYAGADNSLVFLLSYKGSFKVTAYDKYDNVLSSVNLTKDSFVNSFNVNGLKFAKVNFGNGMQLANGIDSTKACISDPMVEWGGGVSGVYEENQYTGTNHNCVKSNDTYVKDHSLYKIEIQPNNMTNKKFTYTLVKPLPFANRVFIATLDKNQERKYRCYDDFSKCKDTDFSEAK